MSEENRDDATGQLSSAEPLFGREGIEREQGYVPFKDEAESEEPEAVTVAEAAEQLSVSRTAEADIRTYSPLDDLADNVTLTLEQATKITSDMREADAAQAEQEAGDQLRKEVDELRGVKPDADQSKEAKEEAAPVKDGEIDVEIERALNHPKIREAIEQQIGEAEQQRQAYSRAVDVANEFARASLFQNVPEIASLPIEQWDAALMSMRQTSPDRFSQVIGGVQRVAELQAAQQQQQQQAALRERHEIEAYSRAESARFDAMIKSEPKETRRAVESSIVEAIKEYGGDTAEFFELLKTSKLLNSSIAQRILYDAGKYRQMQAAQKTAAAKVVAKPLPPVQRPGTAGARMAGNAPDLSALDRRLSNSGSVKDAAALYLAQQARKRG